MDRNVPYMPAVKNLHSILDKVQHAAVPETFSYEFLRDLGFTSSNDRSILKILKYLGMVDTSGHPQSSYKDFVDYTKTKHVLAQRLKAAYGDLYISQKKAHEKSVGELKGWFKSKTGKGDAVALKMATTFKYLASYADFSKELKETPVHPEAESQVKPEQEKPKAEQTADRGAGKIGLGYRLEIHLPDNQTIEIINDLFLKTIEAAKVNSAGYCLYVHSSSMPTNTSAEAEELIAPGTRTFKNRYVELLVDYYQQLPSPSDKQYFVSFLSDRLKPSEGLRPESVVVCAALLRVGELTELAEQLGSWVDFSEPYLTCLEALAEMLRFEPDGFSDADLTEISSLSSRIGERIDFLEKREQRRRGYYFEPDQMVDKVRQLTGKLSLLAAEVPLYRYRRSILESTNFEINHDYRELVESAERLGLSKGLAAQLQHIEETFRGGKDDFDFVACVRSGRSFQENMLAEVVTLVSGLRTSPFVDDAKNIGHCTKYLVSEQILTSGEKGLFGSFYGFLSDEGAHSAFADREQARIAKNILIELSWLLMQRLEALRSEGSNS